MTYPNLSKEDNEKLIKIINDISKKHKTLNEKLIIMGDFNFPGIDWEFESTANVDESHIENEFLTCLHSNFLFQLIEKCTHFRGEQSPTLIDLLISNDPDVLNNIYIIKRYVYFISVSLSLCISVAVSGELFQIKN